MKKEEYENIKSISFPNTVADSDKAFYQTTSGHRFEQVLENGEMAHVSWIAVYKDDKKIAQIKQSVCDIYFK